MTVPTQDEIELVTTFMTVEDAIDIVCALARQNIIEAQDHPEAHARQKMACDTIDDFAVWLRLSSFGSPTL